MILHAIEAGPVDTVGYLLADEATGEAVVIDVPLQSADELASVIRDHNMRVGTILLTHGHFDHVGEVHALSEMLGARVAIGTLDAPMLEDPASSMFKLPFTIQGMKAHQLLNGGEVISIGKLRLAVIHAPGHTPGHVVFHEAQENVLFSGDVLFHSSIGRTDLPGGDYDTLMKSISTSLLTLPEHTVVYPGHGPHTTIGFEKTHNPFILEYFDHF
jgi:glyoxylase-like metal-dependent hydrolase (beta-lactamase superfamily II)